MSVSLIVTFIAACIVLGLTPGPNMSLIMANTLGRGLGAGLVTLAGAGLGLAILVSIAAGGMTSVMVLMADWFDVIRWIGAVYLVWLGVTQLRMYLRRRGGFVPPVPPAGSRRSYFLQGLAVSLSNPKVILFLGAFLPQFVTPGDDTAFQLLVLAVLFVVTLVLVDVAYTVAIGVLRARVDIRKLAVLDGLAGVLLLAGGLVLATTRRP